MMAVTVVAAGGDCVTFGCDWGTLETSSVKVPMGEGGVATVMMRAEREGVFEVPALRVRKGGVWREGKGGAYVLI